MSSLTMWLFGSNIYNFITLNSASGSQLIVGLRDKKLGVEQLIITVGQLSLCLQFENLKLYNRLLDRETWREQLKGIQLNDRVKETERKKDKICYYLFIFYCSIYLQFATPTEMLKYFKYSFHFLILALIRHLSSSFIWCCPLNLGKILK